MPDRIIYHTPGSCSRIALIALEEIGLPYGERCVEIMRGGHHAPDFLAINPKAKIPVLVDDGVVLTELPVILYHLGNAHPDTGLLPLGADGRVDLTALSDLAWIAGVLHSTAGRTFRPQAVSDADPDGVKAIAMTQLAGHAAMISARLEARDWWYGDRWSITDSFLVWVYALGTQYGFPIMDFPVLAAHRARAEARPAFLKVRAHEQALVARDAIAMPPGFAL